MTFTGAIDAACMLPLRAIINTSVALGIHPNVLTLIGVLINVVAAWYLATDRFCMAGVIMIVANIFDSSTARSRISPARSRSSARSGI